jgi:hypothetical protein
MDIPRREHPLVIQVFDRLNEDIQRLIMLNMDAEDAIKLCEQGKSKLIMENRKVIACKDNDRVWNDLIKRDFGITSSAKKNYMAYKALEKVNADEAYLLLGAYGKYLEKHTWGELFQTVFGYGYSYINMLEYIKKNNVDTNLKDNEKNTLIMTYPYTYNLPFVKELLQLGTDVNIPGDANYYPLYAASLLDNKDASAIFDLILPLSTLDTINAQNGVKNEVSRVIDVARKLNNQSRVEKLLARGADP